MTPVWTIAPFVLLLLSIAILPLIAHRFWKSNRNKAIVALVISIPAVLWLATYDLTAIAHTVREYLSFICLLASLYVISGGILVTGDLKATPLVNTLFLLIGAVLANFIGTTGASMVLVRPFLRTNSERRNVAHLPVFFIFIVSNCGGLLTPLGDPPLFLGYLRGVPFFWTLKLFPIWCFIVGALLAIFCIWDTNSYLRESKEVKVRDSRHVEPIRFHGARNLLFIGGVLYGVFLPSPWRELLMLHMLVMSLIFGSRSARRGNRFSFGPIIEVAVLFAGIFLTMVPALQLLKECAPSFGISKPWQFFWLTGAISGALDNAPTYLTFLSIAQGLGGATEIVGTTGKILTAISVGAVLMGANTYIGNGPNFMVKTLAEHAGFKTPSFFGYLKYVFAVLVPLYAITHFVFF